MAEKIETIKGHGITENTPLHIITNAGSFYKNLHYNTAAITGATPEPAGWVGVCLGTTSGGGKVDVTPEYIDIEADGATVAVRGMRQKVGEKATMEMNLIEFKKETLIDALHLVKDSAKSKTGCECYISKPKLVDSDYFENVGYVGEKAGGGKIIIIYPNALVTGSFTVEGKNKTQASFALTAECCATFAQDDLTHLPYEFWFPDAEIPKV
ncbi:MAG: hypothetical protein RR233_08355 [Clostridiales bacterium]